MNAKRLAELFRQRASLDLEIAQAFAEGERGPQRKRHAPEPDSQPSQAAVDDVRRKLRRKGVAA